MKWNSLLKAGGRANHEIISSFSWIGGLWPLPAAGAPPRRENKEEMIEWVSEPPKKGSAVCLCGSQSMNDNELIDGAERRQTSGAPSGPLPRGKPSKPNSNSIQRGWSCEASVELDLLGLCGVNFLFRKLNFMKFVGYGPEAPLPRRNSIPQSFSSCFIPFFLPSACLWLKKRRAAEGNSLNCLMIEVSWVKWTVCWAGNS